MIEVNDSNFEAEVLNSETPVIVDFWAPWCGPCKSMGPVFEALAPEYAGAVKFVKVNVDDCDDIPAKYGIRGIPTLMTFNGGQVVKATSGAQPKAAIKTLVETLLPKEEQ